MSQRTRKISVFGIALGCLAAALILPAWLHGYDTNRPATSHRLVVHEWGTFTSFAGSNGVNLEYRPLASNGRFSTPDLPRFVMDAYSQPGGFIASFTKERVIARQRMETPVTYFYTDVPRVVNARVEFPTGLLTEWYPVVKNPEPFNLPNQPRRMGHTYLDWGAVRLTPQEQFADVRVRDSEGLPMPATLPKVSADDHYGQARETDSAIVETLDAKRNSHFEKFLFYRGLGNFDLPIKLVSLGQQRFEITNAADYASGALLLVRIEQDSIRFTRIDPLHTRETIEVALPSESSTIESLAAATVGELVQAGLYEKEAVAMVNTWRGSWFGEIGTRLLYLLPQRLTDELLPLSIEPAPDDCVRILVGRLETLTPEDGQQLVQTLVGNGVGDEPSAAAIKDELAKLGRFAEPTLQYLISQTEDRATKARLHAILAQVQEGKPGNFQLRTRGQKNVGTGIGNDQGLLIPHTVLPLLQ